MTQRPVWIALAVAGTIATAFSGCNGGTKVPTLPTPGPTCSPPAGTQTALVYPAPNSTAIPDQFGQIVIGSAPALPSSWNVVVTTAISPNGVGGGKLVAAATPIPSPTATPGFAGAVYQSSSFGSANFPGEVVTVFLNDTASNCTPSGPLGQFTTQ
ncbi:MAG TPA: hypothetical protein VFL13_06435 [Candidatus Baltobacteraceae bacterium]|nr:hypothetical protein [Candidatus Baltobacteraceae bacterium]